jgi:hypothetical protein
VPVDDVWELSGRIDRRGVWVEAGKLGRSQVADTVVRRNMFRDGLERGITKTRARRTMLSES